MSQRGGSKEWKGGGQSRGDGGGRGGPRGGQSRGGDRPRGGGQGRGDGGGQSGGYDRGGDRGGPRGGGRGDGGRGFSRGGDRGGRGFGGGFDRGGPRGGNTKVDFVQDKITFYSEKDFKNIDRKFGRGWKPFDFETKADVRLQKYEGPQAQDNQKLISISVNHFPLKNFTLPREIYHYEVAMERVRRDPQIAATSKEPPLSQKKGKGGTARKISPKKDSFDSKQPVPAKKLPKPIPQLVLDVLLKKIRTQTKNHGVVSDLSNNIYSTIKLEEYISLVHEISMADVDPIILQEDDNGLIKVTIQPTDLQIDTSALADYLNRNQDSWKGCDMNVATKTTLEQVYNAIVKSMPNFRFIPLGRSNLMTWPEGKADYLGSNVVCWKGIAANISLGWRPYLCADVAHCPFVDDIKVYDALAEKLRMEYERIGQVQSWSQNQFDDAKSFLKNLKVFYNLPNGKKLAGPVTAILDNSPKDEHFSFENREISVEQYYFKQYGIRLKFPDGPCLQLRGKSQVPAELCTIKKGQGFSRKLDDNQTREMLTLAKKYPNVLEREIKTSIRNMKLEQNQILKAWGVNISSDFLKLERTRVLPAPKLRYGDGTKENEGRGQAEISPNEGQWEIWNSQFQFFEPKEIKKWGFLIAGDCRVNNSKVDEFIQLLVKNGQSKGVNFIERQPVFTQANSLRDFSDPGTAKRNVDELRKIFEGHFLKNGCTLVVVVVPKKNCSIYAHVKQAAELHVGILTQCVVGQNVFKSQPATIQNMLLKINSKLGGINHVIINPPDKTQLKYINILECPMLIMGADVTHPPPGTTTRIKNMEVAIPSFAAVTGSIDKTGMPFMMDIRAQRKADKGAAEVIQNLDKIVLLMLQTFEQKTKNPQTPNGIRPRKIIYYRDGVGEGQFAEVLHTEMLAIRKACGMLTDYDGSKYEPMITFITVQKRHKTRFFYHPSPGQTDNGPAGTVVDTQIVHQTETDFYLLSHKGMMGTSRPTRYHVLWDDNKFTADQIQTLTYFLCYMYVRCNKSVKIPAPTYYAHHSCIRAKALILGLEEHFGDLDRLNVIMRRHEAFVRRFPMHFV